MKKITILMMGLCSVAVFAQQKTTGAIAASNNLTASLTLDNGTQQVLLTLTGPNDRWFALQFGSFDGGMPEDLLPNHRDPRFAHWLRNR